MAPTQSPQLFFVGNSPARATMLLILLLLVSYQSVFATQGYTFSYHFHPNNNEQINECIQSAIARIMRDTCLVFQHNPRARNAILFLESSRCGWQEANSTVHLGSDCITPNHCAEYVHHAVAGERLHPSSVIRHLNMKFNCTDKCNISCENGGNVTETCDCHCAYGFTGKRCENLKFQSRFTDPSCGFIKAHRQGVLSLKQRDSDRPALCQWVLRTDDPWERIELEFQELDFDYENTAPGQNCPDHLSIFGANGDALGSRHPIPCDSLNLGTVLGGKVRSDGNFLMIEYRGSLLSSPREHKGPVLQYSVIAPPPPASNEIRSYKYGRAYSAAASSALHAGGLWLWSLAALLPALLALICGG